MLDSFERVETFLPVDPLSFSGAFLCFFVPLGFILLRYFVVSYIAYIFTWKRNIFSFKTVHSQKVKKDQFKIEIFYSVLSSCIFSIASLIMAICWKLNITLMYLDLGSLSYLVFSFFSLCLLHEFYFYSTHVLMHRPRWYKRVHAIHHYSSETSPFTSFSFHPLEAIVHAAFLPVVIFIVPLHPVVLICYLIFMTLTAVSNHSGVEIFSSGLIRKYFISGEFHGQHHLKFNVNFGLYFTFMDKVFKTEYKQKKKNNSLIISGEFHGE